MARAFQVVVTCDVDENDDVADLRTVRFAVNGHDYEMDLCAEHLDEFSAAVQPYLSLGRKAANGKGIRPTTSKARRAAAAGSKPSDDRANLSDVRVWARAHGYEIGERGRISQEIKQAYAAAQ